MSCRRLFSIEYNNKKFMIFIDENDRRTFLEINNQGKYEYPMLEDFLTLHKIFNNKNPFICYNIQKFTFKECVKATKNGIVSLLTVITILNSMPTALAVSNIEVKENSIVITENDIDLSWKKQLLASYITLDEYLKDTNLTKELILETIDNNNDLPENIKEIARKQFIEFYEEHPNANYGKFYLNIKTLKCQILAPDEYRKIAAPGSAAYYSIYDNIICLQTDYEEAIVRHELSHTYQCLFFNNKKDTFIDISNYKNIALNEGITDIMAKDEKNGGSYGISSGVAKILISISDFTFEEYMQHGVDYLIEKCEKIYPDIDFNYISKTLDTLKNARIYQNIKIEKDPIEMYDELFKLVLKRISLKNGYEPFIRFLNCLTEVKDKSIIDEYLKKYTKELEKIGYFNTKQGQKIRENIKLYGQFNYIVYSPGNEFDISVGIMNKNNYSMQIINDDGTVTDIENSRSLRLDNISKIKILISGDNIRDNIINYLKDINYKNYIYESISIAINKKLLTTTMIGNLRIQIGFTTNNDLGFIISDKNGEIIYKTAENLINLSSPKILTYYLSIYNNGHYKAVELSEVLNENYLKEVQNKQQLFENIEIIDGKIKLKEQEINKQNDQTAENEEKSINENNSIIYLNDLVISKCDIKDLCITIGQTKEGKIGYTISEKNGFSIYKSTEEIKDTSNPVNLENYIGNTSELINIYLDKYLNEEYLRNFQKETGMFNNIELIGDKIVIDNTPKIIIQFKENEKTINSTYKLSQLKVCSKNGVITLISSNLPNIEDYDYIINIKDILEYSNYLNDGIPLYRITIEELIEITNNYLENEKNKGVER